MASSFLSPAVTTAANASSTSPVCAARGYQLDGGMVNAADAHRWYLEALDNATPNYTPPKEEKQKRRKRKQIRDPNAPNLRTVISKQNFVPLITSRLQHIADVMKDMLEIRDSEQNRRKRNSDDKRRDVPSYEHGNLVVVQTGLLSNPSKTGPTAFSATDRRLRTKSLPSSSRPFR